MSVELAITRATLSAGIPALVPAASFASCSKPAAAVVDAALLRAQEMQHRELAVGAFARAEMAAARKANPAWFMDFDETDLAAAGFEELNRLMKTAPTTFTQGLVYGQLLMRLNNCAVTGTEF